MRMVPEQFMEVNTDQDYMTPCSPPQPTRPGWRGILIKAPERIYFKKDEFSSETGSTVILPICGFSMLDVEMIPDDAEPDPMKFFAKNIDTDVMYSGPKRDIKPQRQATDPDEEPLDPDEIEGMATGGYFNLNLLKFVPLPQESGRYEIHIEFSGKISNTVPVRLVEEN